MAGTAGPALAAPAVQRTPTAYTFTTLDNQADPTFNQLLGINDHGTIAGFVTTAGGADEAYVLKANGKLRLLSVPGSKTTQAFGISNTGEVVGSYIDAANATHGFTWTSKAGFQSIDDPNGVGTTTLNGVNDQGDLVGFYTDAAGNTDGLLAIP